MNHRPTLWVAGAHRGARALARYLLSPGNATWFGECAVVDPHPGRAEQFLQSLPIHGRALMADAADVLGRADARDTAAITVDTLAATRRAISAARNQRLVFQLVGRNAGFGGVHFALGGILRPGDDRARADIEVILATLDEINSTPKSSSRAVADTGDPLPPLLLAPLRDRISAAITSDLLRSEAGLTSSGMTLVLPNRKFRLLPSRDASPPSLENRKEIAAALAREHGTTSDTGVAFFNDSEPRIQVLLLRTDRSGRWSVHGIHDFARPPDGAPKLTVTD